MISDSNMVTCGIYETSPPHKEGRKGLDIEPQTQEKCELGTHLCRELMVYSRFEALGKGVALGERGGVRLLGESPHGKVG